MLLERILKWLGRDEARAGAQDEASTLPSGERPGSDDVSKSEEGLHGTEPVTEKVKVDAAASNPD